MEKYDLLSIGEIAELLGVSNQRVHQLAGTDEFPQPVAELKVGRIWRRVDIERWMRKTGRA